MSAYKRFEMWMAGKCPNCKERKLSLIPKSYKPKKPIHYKCLNCSSKYYYPHFWYSILLGIAIISPTVIRGAFDITDLGFGFKLFILVAPIMFIFVIGVPILPKKPYIADKWNDE